MLVVRIAGCVLAFARAHQQILYRLLRVRGRYLPGTRLAPVPQEEIRRAVVLLNRRPLCKYWSLGEANASTTHRCVTQNVR